MTDDDLNDRLRAQERLYEATLDSEVTVAAIDFLARASLLTRITDDLPAAAEARHSGVDGAPGSRRRRSSNADYQPGEHEADASI